MDLAVLIVFGTRWHFRPPAGAWAGVLNCPECAGPQQFGEREAFKAFTVYWFPLVRLREGGRVVQCSRCAGVFEPPIELGLSLSPAALA